MVCLGNVEVDFWRGCGDNEMKIDMAPNIETIRRLFNDHITTHRELPESARLRDLGGEKELIRDYSGRVVFELLQNALDRCEKKVVIALCMREWGNALIIGNDGSPVSAHDRILDTGSVKGASDFHALLSLHSSTKSAHESIGNKGVGFRSVFASSSKVAVWSRCSDGAWWSLEMAHPSTMTPAEKVRWEENSVASFYNPSYRYAQDDSSLAKLLGIDESLQLHLPSLVTLVILPEINPEHLDDSRDIATSIRQLQESTLGFLREKYPGKNTVIDILRIEASNSNSVSKEIEFAPDWVISRGESIQLNEAIRERSGLELEAARVIVALPPTVPGEEFNVQGYYWSYLPTEQLAGFGVHIHADFYLNNSRRNVTFRFGKSNEPQFYNGSLLVSAANAIVHGLWYDKRVLARDDFWQLANPNLCKCEQLKNKVAEQFLQQDYFTRIVSESFPTGGIWKLRRYKDLFKTINDWADYLYRNRVEGIEQSTLTNLRERYWKYVRNSNAAVFPIIGTTDNNELVSDAITLPPKLEAGGSGRDVNVYYRSSNSQDAERFELPEVVKRQKSYVTSFRPEGMSDSDCGMVDYNRVEILGRLKPGTTDDEHRELLKFALKMAMERAERGEQESVLDRCLNYMTPGWRFLLKAESNSKITNLLRASFALTTLHVPTLNGEWLPAHTVTIYTSNEVEACMNNGTDWLWPVVDFPLLNVIASEIESTTCVDVYSLCMLLGITPGPLLVESNAAIRLDSFGTDLATRNRVFSAIISSWETFLGPLCRPELALLAPLYSQIKNEKWVPTSWSAYEEKICGGTLKTAIGYSTAYIEPHRIWHERVQAGGFRAKHLTVLCPRDGKGLPRWACQCGIVEVGQDASVDKISTAVFDLQQQKYKTKDISELYTRLIKSIDEEQVSSDLPILARYFNNGILQKIDWAHTDEKVFFDSGEHTTYISGFEEIAVWAVRRHKQKIARKLGITTFNPFKEIQKSGVRNPVIEQRLQVLIGRAVPDIIVATRLFSQQSVEFNEDKALEKWVKIQFEHYDDVWMELQQEGLKKGHLGHTEAGNIFPLNETNTLIYDLGEAHDINQFLLECALPLAEILCENRAFVTVFSQVLTAWSHASSVTGKEVPTSVQRLRRDLGIDDEDLTDVSKQIATYAISEEEKLLWQYGINCALTCFGELNGSEVQPGITITQEYWSGFRSDISCNQQLVQSKLKECLTDIATNREFLIPIVDFTLINRQKLIALSASKLDLLLAQRAVSINLTPDEVQQLPLERNRIFSQLEFHDSPTLLEANPTEEQLTQILEQLVGIAGNVVQNDAFNTIFTFLRDGIWPIDENSIVSESISADHFNAPTSTSPLTPMTDEVRLKFDHQKSIEGAKAEMGLLSLAKKRALEWISEDDDGFWTELLSTLAANPNDEIRNLIAARGPLEDVLHVSTWWGNAGFDILVPEKSLKDGTWSFIHVEVKRVNADSGLLQFHLSENERIKAMDAAQRDPLWRLWLISLPDCKVRDVTSSLPDSTKVNGLVAQFIQCGMKPESYLLRMKIESSFK